MKRAAEAGGSMRNRADGVFDYIFSCAKAGDMARTYTVEYAWRCLANARANL
jgi:hypothetical protein